MKQIGFLALVFAALLVAVIVKETSRPSGGELRDQVALVDVATQPFTPADVTGIDVTGRDGTPLFGIAREDERWVVTQPFRAPAAAGTVLAFSEAIAAARGELRLDDRAALSKFDLGDGEAPTVKVTGAGGKVLAHVAIGKSSGQNGCFVRLLHDATESDRAYAVSVNLRGTLGLARSLPGSKSSSDPEATHFQDKNLPTLKVAAATKLTLMTPLWRLALERGEEAWEVTEGGPAGKLALKQAGIDRLVRQLQSGVAATALADPATKAALGLDAPTYRVIATLPDGSERALVGVADHEAQKFHARLDVEQDPDVVYEIAGHQWGMMFPPGSGLFEFPRLSPPEEARAMIDITSDEGFVRMFRNPDNSWRLVEPDWGLAANDGALRSLAGMVPNLQPTDWVDDAVLADFGAAAITIEYGPLPGAGATTDGSTKIEIGGKTPAGDNRLARLPNMPGQIVVLGDSTVDRLAPPLFDLFEPRILFDWDDLDVSRIEVRPLAGVSSTPFEVARAGDDAWMLREIGAAGQVDGPADPIAVDDWIAALVDAEASGVEESPGHPTHALVLHREGGESTTLGMRADGTAGYVVFTGTFGDTPEVRKAFRVATEGLLPEVAGLRAAVPEDGGDGDGDNDDD